MLKKQKQTSFSLRPVSYLFCRTLRAWRKEQKLYEKCDQKTDLLAANAGQET
jgi:hypothetical protein